MAADIPGVKINETVMVLLLGQAVQKAQLFSGVRVIVAVPLKGALAVPKLEMLEVIAIHGGLVVTLFRNEAPVTTSESGVGEPLDIVTQRPPATLEPVHPEAYDIGIVGRVDVKPVTL
jgi:hypothetical protein